MKRLLIRTFASIFIISLFSGNVHGQVEILDQVRQLLQKNEELLRIAKGLVFDTSSAKARASLLASISLQHKARKLFNLAEDNYMKGNWKFAMQQVTEAKDVAFSARDAITRTIALAKNEAKTEENALKAIDRARRSLETARDLLLDSEGQQFFSARRLIKDSRLQLDHSIDNLREHMYEVAFRLARLSESLSIRATRILKRETRAVDEISREMDKTDRALERINEYRGIEKSPNSSKILDEAAGLQAKAKTSFEDKRFRAALDYTKKARNLALKALSMLTNDMGYDNIISKIELTDQLIKKAYNIIKNNKLDQLEYRLDNALRIQEKAKAEVERNRLKNALRLTNKAKNIVRETLNNLSTPLKLEEVKKALENTDELLERLRTNDRVENNEVAKELLRRSLKHQQRAWEGFNDNKLKEALTHTRLARNLARKVMEQIGNEGI